MHLAFTFKIFFNSKQTTHHRKLSRNIQIYTDDRQHKDIKEHSNTCCTRLRINDVHIVINDKINYTQRLVASVSGHFDGQIVSWFPVEFLTMT